MAIIPQKQLFSWTEIEALGDLDRLRLVLHHLPDESLMRTLERRRGNGRDDYPIRAVWNSILAGVVYQHPSVESLRRELLRNAQLRLMCGFDACRADGAVPPSWAYTRFLKRLMAHQEEIDRLFDRLVERLRDALPEFGKVLAIDGKAVKTHAQARRKGVAPLPPDGRRDTDADFGAKRHRGVKADGTLYDRVRYWFGYKLHLVVDAEYELPVAYGVTRASQAEQPQAHRLLDDLVERHPAVLDGCEALVGDKGYDQTALLIRLWDRHEIRPVIPVRSDWSKEEPTRRVSRLRHVVYNQQGEVYCYARRGAPKRMAFGGYEADRETLKYRCPAIQYGLTCPDARRCPSAVRIPLSEDRPVFLPLARTTYRWDDLYRKRSAVERVNGRLGDVFGLDRHFIRGLKKMRFRVGLSLVVMLAMALGRAKEERRDRLRSLVQAA